MKIKKIKDASPVQKRLFSLTITVRKLKKKKNDKFENDEFKNEVHLYYRCKKCGSEIYWNTRGKLIYCECEAIGIDSCNDYTRIIGGKNDYELIYQ